MRGECVIDRPGKTTTDAQGDTSTPLVRVYSGCCYTRYPGLAWEQTPESAGATVVASKLVVRIPFGTIIRPGDRVTITEDPDNPQLVGTPLRVASIDDQSQASAQRLICDDFQAGVA